MADRIFLTAYNVAVSLKFILSFNDELRQDFSDQRKMCFSWGIWNIWLRKKTFWSVQEGSKKTMVLVEKDFAEQCGHGSIVAGGTKEPDLRHYGRTDLFPGMLLGLCMVYCNPKDYGTACLKSEAGGREGHQ